MVEMVSLQGEPVAVKIYQPTTHLGDAILIHGFTGSKEDFDYIAPLLANRGYRVATFDNRGQNESPHSKRADSYSVESLARDVVELSQYLKLDSPHLLGHSLGGVIAQRAVLSQSGLFQSLTLLCSGPSTMPKPRYAPIIAQLESTSSMQEMWDLYFNEELMGNYRYELMRDRWLRSDKRSVETHAQVLSTFTSIVPEVAATKIPAYVIYGENDDAWPLEMQNEMAADLSAPVTVISEAGHCPNEDQPAATATAVADFWDLNN